MIPSRSYEFQIGFFTSGLIDLSCSSIGLYIDCEFGECPMAPKVKSSLFGCKNLLIASRELKES